MMPFEKQYYFLHPPDVNNVLFIAADEDTTERPYLGAELLPGPPLRFVDAQADDPDADPGPRQITDVLHGAGLIVLHDRLRARLEEFETPGMQFYPMVLVDAEGNEHGDHWLLNVFEEQPFIDFKKSELLDDEDDPDDPEADAILVMKFVFDKK